MPVSVGNPTETGIKRHHVLWNLGPDLLKAEWSRHETLQRLREQQDKPIGEVLMRRNIVSS